MDLDHSITKKVLLWKDYEIMKEELKPLKGLPVPLLRQSDGKPSASFTMAFLAFNACLLWLLLSIFEGIGPLKVRAFDASGATLFLTPILGLYFSRRYTDSKGNLIKTIEESPDEITIESEEKIKSDSET